jgi:hypothetical protein
MLWRPASHVMEASVAMKWVIDETGTPEALLLRDAPDPGASTTAARCKVPAPHQGGFGRNGVT